MHAKTPFPNFWKHSCTRKHRFQTFGNTITLMSNLKNN
jgi:hypothetical protein